MLGSLLVAVLLAEAGEPPVIAVVPVVGSAAISDARATEVAQQIAAALAASGFAVKAEGARAIVTVEAGEVRDNVAVELRATLPGQATPLAQASFLLQKKEGQAALVARVADFARALEAALPRPPPPAVVAAPPVEPARAPAPEPAPEPEPVAPPVAVVPEAPAEVEGAPERDSGAIVFLRADGDVFGGFSAGVGAGCTFGVLGVEATLLLPRSAVGARLELKVVPFDFAWVRPFAAVGATCFFADGWGGAAVPGASVFALGPRGALGAELQLGGLRVRADVAVEGFIARSRPADFRALAVLVGGAAAWQF